MATKKPPAETEHAADVKTLSFRAANAKYHISYEVWRRVKDGKQDAWVPYRGGGFHEADVDAVLRSVRADPHYNTVVRARVLGRRTEAVQTILVAEGLQRLTARLKYAGYSVEPNPSLARARQHRVLAAGPGVYTCCDFKRFGATRAVGAGLRESEVRGLSGLVVVDQYSGWGAVALCAEQNSATAAAGVRFYIKGAPFPVEGVILSDNGLPFLSDDFIQLCAAHRLVQRTTQFNHPWSNGKVESLNRTLKYQCFPTVAGIKPKTVAEAQAFVDKWMQWYNTRRAHAGWINRGLPPQAVIARWQATSGDVFQRLCALGHIKPHEVPRTRLMGSGKHAVDWKLHDTDAGAPFAFIIEAPPRSGPPGELPPGLTLQP